MPDDLEPYLSQLPEEGDKSDGSADFPPPEEGSAISGIRIARQDARQSSPGHFYEIHGRSGLVTVLRGELEVLLDGCPLHLRQGFSFTYVPFQTRYFIRESRDALLCRVLFDCRDEADLSCCAAGSGRMRPGRPAASGSSSRTAPACTACIA